MHTRAGQVLRLARIRRRERSALIGVYGAPRCVFFSSDLRTCGQGDEYIFFFFLITRWVNREVIRLDSCRRRARYVRDAG